MMSAGPDFTPRSPHFFPSQKEGASLETMASGIGGGGTWADPTGRSAWCIGHASAGGWSGIHAAAGSDHTEEQGGEKRNACST